VGAVIVKDKVVIATGYNGSPRGLEHCDDIGHEMVEGHCIRTVHAEANAVSSAAKRGTMIDGSTVYSTASPCYDCFKLLINCGAKRVVCGSFYGSRYGASEKIVALAAQAGIKLDFIRSYSDIDHSLDPDTARLDVKKIAQTLKVKKLHPSAKVPEFAYDGDAGLDLFAVEGISIGKGERVKVPTGVAVEIPSGFVGLIWDKTGISFKKGLKIVGGVVDSSYRGEIFALMANISDQPVEIMQGDKIAQMIIQPFEHPQIEVADELSETERGSKMLGSSDAKVIEEVGEIEEPAPEDYGVLEDDENDKKEEEDESQESRW